MYGLLLEGIRQFITTTYGEEAWENILIQSEINISVFTIHKIYSEEVILCIIKTAVSCLNLSLDELMFKNGQFFIGFLSQYGYDSILRVLGRDLRDFLNGLDNLHEYLRFSYPKLKPPSFFCVNESRSGLTLQYRTQRKGFIHYVRGQIFEISRKFYETDVHVEIITESLLSNNVYNCIFRLHFENLSFKSDDDVSSVPSEIFFEVFPFNIIFNRGLKIVNCGRGMRNLVPDIIGEIVNERFFISRPLIEISWDSINLHSNNIFELILLHNKKFNHEDEGISREFPPMLTIQDASNSSSNQSSISAGTTVGLPNELNWSIYSNPQHVNNKDDYRLRMRGQMKYMNEWDAIVFLGTPIMRDVNSMYRAGLFINDLSLHDSSRDLVLAGEQQSAELRLALEQESEKSKRLEDSLRRLDDEMKRTDELLYQMIPRAVANRLRNGEKSVNTCETFNEVTVLFSDVVGFTKICSGIAPLDVVEMLNTMYSVFDQLTEYHCVYKVETIGDAYMIASGCPVLTEFNAPLIAETAIDMIHHINQVKDPSDSCSEHLKIRVGIHTGTVVAGVVGIKMPRYCLFGDSVNTASRMESTGQSQKIQISSSTRDKLVTYNVYDICQRGLIELKGKGQMTTHWLRGHIRKNQESLDHFFELLNRECERLGDANMSTLQISSDNAGGGYQGWTRGFQSTSSEKFRRRRLRNNSLLPISPSENESTVNINPPTHADLAEVTNESTDNDKDKVFYNGH